MEYVIQILQDILTLIYQYAGISIICSVLFIIVWGQAEKESWRVIGRKIKEQLSDRKWKKRFVMVMYIVFVLQRTIFNREPWGNPLSNVLGNWWFIQNDIPNYEMFENILLFIPLYPVFKMGKIDMHIKHFRRIGLWGCILIPFECSLSIEIIQLMFRVGSFQISDLCYNTLGGVLGAMFYYLITYFIGRGIHDEQNNAQQ